VELLFDVQQSPNLNGTQKQRILSSLKSRIGKDGILRMVVDKSRSQRRNREIAIERLTAILRAALKSRKKRLPTKPSAAAHDKRIKSKKLHGEKKLKRRRVMTE
jgi:ribosome-associated protein